MPWGTSISLGYNESTNFQPGQLGVDPFSNPNPSPAGSTKDYSLLITTANDRVTLRLTKFESIQKNTSRRQSPELVDEEPSEPRDERTDGRSLGLKWFQWTCSNHS
jgi:hypothetical protein